MTYPEFEKDRRLQEAAAEYTAKFGGCFGGEEPGVRLMYAPDDEDTAYTPPDGPPLTGCSRTSRAASLSRSSGRRWSMTRTCFIDAGMEVSV